MCRFATPSTPTLSALFLSMIAVIGIVLAPARCVQDVHEAHLEACGNVPGALKLAAMRARESINMAVPMTLEGTASQDYAGQLDRLWERLPPEEQDMVLTLACFDSGKVGRPSTLALNFPCDDRLLLASQQCPVSIAELCHALICHCFLGRAVGARQDTSKPAHQLKLAVQKPKPMNLEGERVRTEFVGGALLIAVLTVTGICAQVVPLTALKLLWDALGGSPTAVDGLLASLGRKGIAEELLPGLLVQLSVPILQSAEACEAAAQHALRLRRWLGASQTTALHVMLTMYGSPATWQAVKEAIPALVHTQVGFLAAARIETIHTTALAGLLMCPLHSHGSVDCLCRAT